MLEEDIKVEKVEGKTFEPLPENMYQVELLDIEVKEHPKYKEPETLEKVFSFQFTVLDGELRGRNIWANFIPTYLYISKNGKNKLFQILEALLGHELSQEEENSIDTAFLNALMGKQCKVMAEIKTKGEKTYNNIIKYLKADTLINALTDEEKDKCRVKNKEDRQSIQSEPKVAENTLKSENSTPSEQSINAQAPIEVTRNEETGEVLVGDVPF